MKTFINRALVAKKHLKLFFALFAMLALNVGNAWAETATLAISSSVTANKTLTDDGSNSWSVTSDGSYNAQTKYIQVGTNSKSVTYLKLSTSAFSTKSISKIQVWATSKASTNVTTKVYVGGNLLGTSSVYTSQTASNGGTEFSVTNPNNYTGDILIEISRPSAANGAIYFNKAIVTYTEAGSTQPTLSVVTVSGNPTKTIYETGEVFVPTGLTVTGTYGTGAETTQKEITSGITWTANNGSEYVALENVSLTQGQTSIQVKATVNEITSEAYTANITVNAAPTKITFLASQLGGTNDTYELKDGSASGVTYKAYSYKKGEGANFQFNGKDGKTNIFYNTSAMPGAITTLKAVKASGTDRSVTPYVSTAPLTKDNYSTVGIALSTKNVVAGGTIWTISEESSLTAEQKSAEYKYFYFHYSTSSALYVSKFEVAYKEVAGGDEGGSDEPVPSLTAK